MNKASNNLKQVIFIQMNKDFRIFTKKNLIFIIIHYTLINVFSC